MAEEGPEEVILAAAETILMAAETIMTATGHLYAAANLERTKMCNMREKKETRIISKTGPDTPDTNSRKKISFF